MPNPLGTGDGGRMPDPMSSRHDASDPALPVAVVTGGHGVLGAAVAEALRAGGWDVRAPGHVELDVTNPVGVRAWFAAIVRCDLLVNNAGIADDALIARMTEAQWDRVVETNLSGAARCAKAVLPGMIRHGGGSILNIGSFSALSGPIGQANYAAAKAGLIGLSRALALEFGSRNIRVNTVLPGFLESPMTRGLPENIRAAALARHTLGRFTSVEESARFIAFLAGCTHVSGQVFGLDSRIADWG